MTAIQQNHPVVFVDIQRIKKGNYTIQLDVISEQPQASSVHEITQKFASKIEMQIRQQPGSYLWSHNRWKHHYKEKEVKA